MYAVKPDVAKTNGAKVKTLRGKAVNGNSDLRVQVGSTGFREDPDQDADVKGLVDIYCLSGDFRFLPVVDEASNYVGIRIVSSGNDELMSLIEALTFAACVGLRQCIDRSDF